MGRFSNLHRSRIHKKRYCCTYSPGNIPVSDLYRILSEIGPKTWMIARGNRQEKVVIRSDSDQTTVGSAIAAECFNNLAPLRGTDRGTMCQ